MVLNTSIAVKSFSAASVQLAAKHSQLLGRAFVELDNGTRVVRGTGNQVLWHSLSVDTLQSRKSRSKIPLPIRLT